MTDDAKGELKQRQVSFDEVTAPPTFVPGGAPTFYANNTQLQVSPWDVSLDFGQIVGRAEEGGLIVQNLVRVILSPSHAKALTHLLARNLQGYEAEFGPIPIPPSIPTPEKSEP